MSQRRFSLINKPITPWTSDIDGAGFGLDNIDRLKIQASGNPGDNITLTHDDTDLLFVGVNTASIRYSGFTSNFVWEGGIGLAVQSADNAKGWLLRQLDVDTQMLGLGASVDLLMTSYDGSLVLEDGMGLRIQDAGDTDWAEFSHDGVDFNTVFTNTADWNISGANVRIVNNIGFYDTAPVAKPSVTGSVGGNAALASLLTALENLGLVTDNTS